MGEFTFTLEDVCGLLNLPCYGQHDLSSIKLSEEEDTVYKFFYGLLKDYHRNSGVVQFFTWISLFHYNYNHKKGETLDPLFPNHEHELVALVAMWLARHALPGCPDYGISPSFILIAIKIAQGKDFPLAPLYLGSLYKRLDLYQSKTKEPVGRYKVLSYVDIIFIQLCLWE